MTEGALWAILLGGLGLVFGSFIATLAIRWPEGRSIATGRSACDGCGRPLRARELVPVLSFLIQRGRCTTCGAPIARAHLATELVAAAIGASAGLAAPGLEGAIGAGFGWLLLALAALDWAALWLPDRLTAALALGGVGEGVFTAFGPTLADRLIGGAAGFGTLWLVAALYRRTRGRHGMGGGDPKMLGAIGLWLGWTALPMLVLIACLVGLCAVAAMALSGRRLDRASPLPFGVMLAVAAWLCWLGMRAPLYLPAATG